MQREVVAGLGGRDARLGGANSGSSSLAPIAGSGGPQMWSSSLSDDAAALLERFDSRSVQLRSLLLDDLFGSETEDGNDDDGLAFDQPMLHVATSVPEPEAPAQPAAAAQAPTVPTPAVTPAVTAQPSQAAPSLTPDPVAAHPSVPAPSSTASSPSRDSRASPRSRPPLPSRVARDLRSQYPPPVAGSVASPNSTPSNASTASSSTSSSPSSPNQVPGLIPTPLSLPTTSQQQQQQQQQAVRVRKRSSPPMIALDSPPNELEWGAPPPPRVAVAASPLATARRAVMTPKPHRDRGVLAQLQQSPGKHENDDLRHINTIADYFPSRSPTEGGHGSTASDSGSPEPPFGPAPLPPPPVLHAHARSYNPSPRHPPIQRFTTPPLRSLSFTSAHQASLVPRISPYRQAESPMLLPEARSGIRPGLLQVPVARSSSVPPARARGLSDEAAVAQFAAQAQAVIDQTLQQARVQLEEVMSGYVSMYAHQLQRDRQRSPHSNVL